MSRQRLVSTLVVLALAMTTDASAKTFTVESTAYCLPGTMADGTQVRKRSVANNFLPLGTRIKIVSPRPWPGGHRIWFVRDRIGWGSALDFWRPQCTQARLWGRRTVRFEVLR